jgi:hypothetical protein
MTKKIKIDKRSTPLAVTICCSLVLLLAAVSVTIPLHQESEARSCDQCMNGTPNDGPTVYSTPATNGILTASPEFWDQLGEYPIP